ncbi:MAG: MBL fold metallo-hydrolase [Pseudomonadota bacterium]
MNSEVSFIAGGGANSIGGSFYMLNVGNKVIGIDYGGQLNRSLGFEPDFSVTDRLDYLFVTHAHFDHVGALPLVRKRFPEVKIFATPETRKLCQVAWGQTIRHFETGKELYRAKDVQEALSSMRPVRAEEVLELEPGLTVYVIPAAHILGAVSYLIEYNGEFYFFTGDVCYEDRSLLAGAPKLTIDGIKVLVRESTYIIESKDRRSAKERLISRVPELMEKGYKILIASLSIDRAQDVFCILAREKLGVPIYLDGSEKIFRIYRDNLQNGAILNEAVWFNSEGERNTFLRGCEPGIVIASSGMMMPSTLSALWARELLPNPKAAIFMVNYQDPTSPGFMVRKSKKGEFMIFDDAIVKRQCLVEYFDLSAHMDKEDGEELEERMNPKTIIYIHGEDAKIDEYIRTHRDGKQRVKALIGKEVFLD